MRALLLLALLPTALWADPPPAPSLPKMSPSEFDLYATGKTLSYAAGGAVWGTEQYLPGRQVMWAFTDQTCQFGSWYDQGDAVCFVYEGDPEPKCWQFFKGPAGVVARFLSDPNGTPLSEVGQSTKPLECTGPQVGA